MALIKISRQKLTAIDSLTRNAVTKLAARQGDLVAKDILTLLNEPETQRGPTQYMFTFHTQGHLIGLCLGEINAHSAHLRHLLIDKNNQSRGIGQNMMYGMFRQLLQSGVDSVRLNSQQRQLQWLEANGFIQLELADSHTPNRQYELINPCLGHYMQSRPSAAANPDAAASHMRIGQDMSTHRFHNEADWLALHRSMLLQARRRIWLMAHTINSPLLLQTETAQAVVQLIKRNPQAEIRLLIEDDRQSAGYYNPTIQALQKLSSYCEIRTLHKTGQRLKDLFTLVDFDASIQRTSTSDYHGQAYYHSRLLSNRLSQNYDQVWQYARPSLELRRLAL